MNAVLKQPITDRSAFIGGSDAGAILGVSPWRTPLDVWLEKTGQAVKDEKALQSRERYFRRGKRLEPVVLEMLAEEHGVIAVARNERYVDPVEPYLACEIDAEASDGRNIEIKTVHPFLAKLWGAEDTDEIPTVYTAQAMHGLMVTGRQETLFAILIGADDLRTYRVVRDEEAIQFLRAREQAFWQLVQNGTPPPVSTLDEVNRIFRRDDGKTVEVQDPLILATINNLRAKKVELKDLEAAIERDEFTIKSAMGDTCVLTIGGKKAISWKSQEARRVDVTALRAQEPVIAERFTTVSASRVFRVS